MLGHWGTGADVFDTWHDFLVVCLVVVFLGYGRGDKKVLKVWRFFEFILEFG